jgi:hypothetical protein
MGWLSRSIIYAGLVLSSTPVVVAGASPLFSRTVVADGASTTLTVSAKSGYRYVISATFRVARRSHLHVLCLSLKRDVRYRLQNSVGQVIQPSRAAIESREISQVIGLMKPVGLCSCNKSMQTPNENALMSKTSLELTRFRGHFRPYGEGVQHGKEAPQLPTGVPA